jgi:hypothetical protein
MSIFNEYATVAKEDGRKYMTAEDFIRKFVNLINIQKRTMMKNWMKNLIK